jgi:hypothetical protein
MRQSVSKTLVVLSLAAAVTGTAAFGQKNKQTHQPAPEKSAAAKMRSGPSRGPKGLEKGREGAARPAANPLTPIDRWNAMNPRQRERMLEKMNPERRKQFVQKLEKFNALPKEEQQLMRERYERLSKLPPEQQQIVRRDSARFEKLPPARRQAMLQEFQKLRKMSESERSAYLASPEFRDQFYPAEQQMIEHLTQVLPARK